MSRYKALQQERADLIKEAKVILAKAETEGRDLTEAEAGRDDAIHGRLQAVDAELVRYERMQAAERSATAVVDGNVQAAANGRATMPRIEGVRDRVEDDPKRGFRHLADFAASIKSAYTPGGAVDERLRYAAAPTDYHFEVGSDEGRMVPPAFREEVWEAVQEYSSVLTDLNPEPTSGNAVEFVRDESTPWGSVGVQARWRNEAGAMTASKLATDPSQLRLHELYAFVTSTGELLQDAPMLINRLTRKAAQAIAYKIDDAVVNGTGAGMPQGWFTSGALVSVAKESAQVADTVVAANIAKMYSRLINPQNGIWYINQDVLPQIITLTLGNQPIWTPPMAGFRDAPPEGGFLLGRPVKVLEPCQTVGDKGDIQFVNPRGYYAITKSTAPEFASSMHLFFDYNVEAFRWIFRLGGQPFLSAAVSPAKGSSTRSHFVVLDARA
jgi:HK97 family phage major capsid protein